MTPLIPDHAIPFFGASRGLPWARANLVTTLFEGMWGKGVVTFPAGPKTPPALLFASDADTDIDGPGGSKAVDPCWQNSTSLRTAAGSSVDSREFPGVVIQAGIQRLGARLGDFTLSVYNGRMIPGQVYDIGPTRKIGENSIYLNRRLGVVKANETDRHAATLGNDAADVVTLIFAGSGPGHALPASLIAEAAADCFAAFLALP